jgi:hypothetical protein
MNLFQAVRTVLSVLCILSLALLPPLRQSAPAQGTPAQGAAGQRELIAVLDMEAVGATAVEATAMSERFREELLKTRQYIMVDRSQIKAILDEQAFQQTGCTDQECAVQVGQILGVKKIVAGKVTKIEETTWLLSAILVDVETSETLRAESFQHRGDYFSLLSLGIGILAAQVAGVEPREELLAAMRAHQAGLAAQQAAAQQVTQEDGGWPWWAWVLIGVGVVGLAAAGGGGGESAPPPTTSTDPCANGCGSVTVGW